MPIPVPPIIGPGIHTPKVSPEVIVIDFLTTMFNGTVDGLPQARIVSELPADLVGSVPLIRVQATAGSDVLPTLDEALVDVEAFAAGRDATRLLAEQIRWAMRLVMPGSTVSGAEYASKAFVATVEASVPHWAPYDDTDVRRFVAMYRLSIRSVATS